MAANTPPPPSPPLNPQSDISESPSYNSELNDLSTAIGLNYPSNPKQINTATLVLSYLMSRGISGPLGILEGQESKNSYLDDFSTEVYLIYYSNTVSLYTKSKPIEVIKKDSPRDPYANITTDSRGNQVSSIIRPDKSEREKIDEELTKSYDLGPDPKRDLIEYKVRKKLLALIKLNPGGVDMLEQIYDAKRLESPFRFIHQIKAGYFNVLMGGNNRRYVDDMKNKVNNALNQASNSVRNTPAAMDNDSISKGK